MRDSTTIVSFPSGLRNGDIYLSKGGGRVIWLTELADKSMLAQRNVSILVRIATKDSTIVENNNWEFDLKVKVLGNIFEMGRKA